MKKYLFGSITCEQIVSHIEKNYQRLDPIQGICSIKLKDYQKNIIKNIIKNNTVIMQSRQMGVTSLYVWVSQALCELIENFSIMFVVRNQVYLNHFKNILKRTNNMLYIKQNVVYFNNNSKIYLQTNYSIFSADSKNYNYDLIICDTAVIDKQ